MIWRRSRLQPGDNFLQGRHMPDSLALAYLKVIARNAKAVEEALA
jgi:hypothetical protein